VDLGIEIHTQFHTRGALEADSNRFRQEERRDGKSAVHPRLSGPGQPYPTLPRPPRAMAPAFLSMRETRAENSYRVRSRRTEISSPTMLTAISAGVSA
jgi:hypothetical protein